MLMAEEISYFWTTAQAVLEDAIKNEKIIVKIKDLEFEVESVSFDWQGKISLNLKT